MDKIKTIVVNNAELTQDLDNKIVLTNDYIELIPKDCVARYLKVNFIFKNFRKNPTIETPFIKINNELCPMFIQEPFEIRSDDDFEINSLQINDDFDVGNIVMILVPNYMKNK